MDGLKKEDTYEKSSFSYRVVFGRGDGLGGRSAAY